MVLFCEKCHYNLVSETEPKNLSQNLALPASQLVPSTGEDEEETDKSLEEESTEQSSQESKVRTISRSVINSSYTVPTCRCESLHSYGSFALILSVLNELN